MKKNSAGVIHLFSIIGIALVGIVGIVFLAVKNDQIKLSPQKDSNTQNTTPTQSAEIDTSGWKTYRNNTNLFQNSPCRLVLRALPGYIK